MSSGAMDITLSDEEDNEQEYYCEYNFTPSVPGFAYRKNGDPGDPPEPEEIEITVLKPYLADHTLGPDCLKDMSEEDVELIEEKISEYEAECDDYDEPEDDDGEEWEEDEEEEDE